MRKWRRESLLLTGHLLFVVGGLAQETVPQDAGDSRVAGVETSPHTTLCEVGQMLGVVAPPGAVVIPEVVERVLCGPDGKDWLVDRFEGCCCCAQLKCICCAHVGRDVWVVTPGTRATKKRPVDRKIRKGA